MFAPTSIGRGSGHRFYEFEPHDVGVEVEVRLGIFDGNGHVVESHDRIMPEALPAFVTLTQWFHVSRRKPAEVVDPCTRWSTRGRQPGSHCETSTTARGGRSPAGTARQKFVHGLDWPHCHDLGLGNADFWLSDMSTERFQNQMAFLMEIDRLKQVERQTSILGGHRRENTAEHSWHLAMYALVLQEWSNADVDLARVLALCLVHDIVEIDAGDTFAYDVAAHDDKEERERRAADRLFGILPEDQATYLHDLWEEYEARDTPESRFANAVDRMQPAMLNHHADDESPWKRHGVTRPQAVRRLSVIGEGSHVLWEHTQRIIDTAVQRGNLIEET